MKIDRIGLLAALTLTGAGMLMATTPVARADQPHMHAALNALENAERQLMIADEDKGGHRSAALEHTRKAIEEVRAGMSFDRRH